MRTAAGARCRQGARPGAGDKRKSRSSPRDLTARGTGLQPSPAGRLLNVSSSPRIVTWVPLAVRPLRVRLSPSTNTRPNETRIVRICQARASRRGLRAARGRRRRARHRRRADAGAADGDAARAADAADRHRPHPRACLRARRGRRRRDRRHHPAMRARARSAGRAPRCRCSPR